MIYRPCKNLYWLVLKMYPNIFPLINDPATQRPMVPQHWGGTWLMLSSNDLFQDICRFGILISLFLCWASEASDQTAREAPCSVCMMNVLQYITERSYWKTDGRGIKPLLLKWGRDAVYFKYILALSKQA